MQSIPRKAPVILVAVVVGTFLIHPTDFFSFFFYQDFISLFT